MKISSIAIPYAKALFDLAKERNELDMVMNDMKVISGVIAGGRDLMIMLKSPIIHSDKKQKILSQVLKGKISETTSSFLSIIIRKRREKYIDDIAQSFMELYKDNKGILTTYVKTAVPVSPEVRQDILKVMKNYTKQEIELVEEIREDLIGGFVLNWKDMQYDASILNQINKLKKNSAKINLFVRKL